MPEYPSCAHTRRVGDNYGETCMDCGRRMSGYGDGGQHRDCEHVFAPAGDVEICIYCEQERRAECCCFEIAGDNPDEEEGSDNRPSTQWSEHGYH